VTACYDACEADETCDNFAFSSEEYMVNGEARIGVCILLQDINTDIIKAMCPAVREEDDPDIIDVSPPNIVHCHSSADPLTHPLTHSPPLHSSLAP
jgi:hypothetical protein